MSFVDFNIWQIKQTKNIATLFAAWNNLLSRVDTPGDNDIVYAARENWHPVNLIIDRAKFFKGLDWMRAQGLVPVGRGRVVAERGASRP